MNIHHKRFNELQPCVHTMFINQLSFIDVIIFDTIIDNILNKFSSTMFSHTAQIVWRFGTFNER